MYDIEVSVGNHWETLKYDMFEVICSRYMYIYSNNTSDVAVKFDNLKIKYFEGKLDYEFHYYPFGLRHQLTAKGKVNGKMPFTLFNSQHLERGEFGHGKGLNLYNYEARMYDMQIGKWGSVDPLALMRVEWSPYNALRCNPIMNIDPTGALDTDYKDENDNLIKHTDDGIDKTVTVKKEDRSKFDIYAKVGEEMGVTSNKGYNEWITKQLGVSSLSTLNISLAGVGTAATFGEIATGKVLDSRSGFTSGKISPNSPVNYSKATASKVNIGAKGLGSALTAWSVFDTESQFKNREISSGRRIDNHLKNGVGLAYPLLAIPIATGDYLGQKYEQQITKSVTQPGGFLFETTNFILKVVGIPTGE